jgi:hypothetical protein
VEIHELLPERTLLAGDASFFVFERYVEPAGQRFDRFSKRQMFCLHHKRDDVAGLSTTEALEKPLVR